MRGEVSGRTPLPTKTLILLAALISASSQAQTVNSHKPNNCLDGGIYRAMTGPEVTIDSAGTKSLAVDGKTLVECKIGNTTTCVGTTYNNYTCSVNFDRVTGDAAAAVARNLAIGTDGLAFTYGITQASACSYMHCTIQETLRWADSSCAVKPQISGWDE